MTTLKPAAIYARFSSDRQDPRSISDQIRRCGAAAPTFGFEIVTEFKDEAKSGASVGRDGLQALLAEAEQGKRCRFRAVLVDDLSRLSRDLCDTLLLRRQLAARGIEIFDCASGVSASDRTGKITTYIRGVINEVYLDDLRDKTRRGLEGRVLAQFWTGGRVYGYATIPEPEPEDPRHVRAVPVVDEEQAKVVRQVFAWRDEGAGLKEIASRLNAAGTPAPYDGSRYRKSAGRGWGHTTVKAMLQNDRYLGLLKWNQREWYRSATGKRRWRWRPESEWKIIEAPQLRIIGDEVWGRVQATFRPGTKGGERPTRHFLLLGGHLRCAQCGSGLSVVGRHREGEKSWATYGCSCNRSKGSEICPNDRTVAELRTNEAVLEALSKYVSSPRFRADIEAEVEAAQRAKPADGIAELERTARSAQARVDKITDAIACVGVSEALRTKLAVEEEKLRRACQALSEATSAPPPPPRPALSVEGVRKAVGDLRRLVQTDPQEARAALREFLEPIVVRPVPDGFELDLAFRNSTAAPGGGCALLATDGCGGRI